MSRFDFTPYRRSTVGFDRLFDLLENQARLNAGDNYPPFNISRRGEDNYRITLAVAGFRPGDIDITAQQNLLVVQGRKRDDAEDEGSEQRQQHRREHGEPEQVAYAQQRDGLHDRPLPLVSTDGCVGDAGLQRYLEEHRAWNPVTLRERELQDRLGIGSA